MLKIYDLVFYCSRNEKLAVYFSQVTSPREQSGYFADS